MTPKKILFIGHTYTAPVNRLKFNYLGQDRRFDILLVAPRRWRNYLTVTDNAPALEPTGYRTLFVEVWLGALSGWHHVLYLIPHLGRIIRDFKPDLIYCEQEPICLVSAQAAAAAGAIPILFFSWENIRRQDIRYRFFTPIRTYCYHRSCAMVAGSRGAAQVIRSHGYRKPIYLTPLLGVSEDLFYPAASTFSAAPGEAEEFVIGYLGRFVDQKDVKTLIAAAALLDRNLKWRLVLMGAGPLEEAYRNQARREGIAERLTFQPAVPHDEVPGFLRSFSALVLPSKTTPTWKEQFGHVLIEAMACGVPVVGSTSGAIPETIGDAGLVFQEGNARDLGGQLTRLAGDTHLRQDLRRRGLARAEARFTDRRIAANTIAVIEKALGLRSAFSNTLEVEPGC